MKKVVKIIRELIIIGAISLAAYMITDQVLNRVKHNHLQNIPEQVETNEHTGTIEPSGFDEEGEDDF